MDLYKNLFVRFSVAMMDSKRLVTAWNKDDFMGYGVIK